MIAFNSMGTKQHSCIFAVFCIIANSPKIFERKFLIETDALCEIREESTRGLPTFCKFVVHIYICSFNLFFHLDTEQMLS